MQTFLATLTPMLTMFFCIAIGFVMTKTKILPESSSQTLAKAVTWIFLPALNMMTMIRFCTVDSLSVHATNLVLSCIILAVAMGIAIPLARVMVREPGEERGAYSYALTFANSSYVGDPVVLAMFGEEALAYYKLFCLPISLAIYTWGISVLTPQSGQKGGALRRALNMPTVAMLIGMAIGLSGTGRYVPGFVISSLDALKACMGPVAMLLAGVTIAKYDFFKLLKNKKVYVATALRLVVLPAVLIAVLYGLKTLANVAFGMAIGNDVLFLCFFAVGAALGLNTVVFPEAFGGNPQTGASMAMISHALCVVSIPLMYTLMIALFGTPFAA